MGLHVVWKNIKYTGIVIIILVAIPFIFKDSEFYNNSTVISYFYDILLTILKALGHLYIWTQKLIDPIYKLILGEEYIKNYSFLIFMPLVLFLLLQNGIIYNKNKKYIIDLDTGSITFPRSDIENSILAIILLVPYWNLYRSKTINANEIENLYIDTKRWQTKHRVHSGTTKTGKSRHRTETKRHVLYTLNIVGTFGSANLQFLDRQKRDEVRNAITQCVKKFTDKNVDKKVAEF